MDYQIVAVFVTENEARQHITDALAIIKLWNPDLNPLFCMTDYCNEEIDTLGDTFQVKVL